MRWHISKILCPRKMPVISEKLFASFLLVTAGGALTWVFCQVSLWCGEMKYVLCVPRESFYDKWQNNSPLLICIEVYMLLAWWHHCSKLWIMRKMEKSLLFLYKDWIQKKLLSALGCGHGCSRFSFSFLTKECKKPKPPWRIRIKGSSVVSFILFLCLYFQIQS